MAGSLESVLAGIPFLSGYEAQNQQNRLREHGDVANAMSLQKMLEAMQQQELMKKLSGAMVGGSGTPEQLDPLITALAIKGHPGAAALAALADKRRNATTAAADAQMQMKAIQSPAPAPVQSAPPDQAGLKLVADTGGQAMIPGTSWTNPSAEQVPPEQRAAFDKVLNDARAKNALARGEGGTFAGLMESEIPSIAQRAKQMQQMANSSPATPAMAAHWQKAYESLAKENTTLLERKSAAEAARWNRPQEPLSAIIGEDGKPVLVPRSEAVGKTPFNPSIAGAGQFTPEALRMTAEQYLTGDRQAIAGYARNATARIALQNEIQKVAKEKGWSGADVAAQMADFAGIMSGSRTVGQRAAQIELASSEAEKMIDIVLQRSKAFERTQFVPINAALRAFETQTGQPEVKAFGAAINSLVNVYARAISPSGVPTVSDKEHAREMLAQADSPAQVQAVMDVMKQEMKAARAAPGDVRTATRRAVTGNEPAAVTPTAPAAPSIEDRLKKYK
jgi:hypothetical protein